MFSRRPSLTANNFDLLRLLFAATVCLVHVCQLSAYPELALIERLLSSDVAVKGFFVVSGFLVFLSFERSPSVIAYAGKRLRRIYPAYFAVVLLCAVGLMAVSSRRPADYFSAAWLDYLAANLSFLNFLWPTLPGVFDGNRVHAVNGALWTLKIEVLFYLSVPVIALLCRRFRRLAVIAAAYFLSVAYAVLLSYAAERTGIRLYAELSRQFPGQLCYFMAGALLYYHLPAFERRWHYLVPIAVVVLALDSHRPLPLVEPLALAAVVIFVAFFRDLGNFGRYGDFSYGVYILHFPIIQCYIHFGGFAGRPWLFLGAATLTTFLAAVAMWHLVEKRFLLRRSHYVVASGAACADAAVSASPNHQPAKGP